jgi:hypothetical protein
MRARRCGIKPYIDSICIQEIIHDDVATTEEPVKTTTEIYTTDFTSGMTTTNANVNPFRGIVIASY